jgi:hypothetical protein
MAKLFAVALYTFPHNFITAKRALSRLSMRALQAKLN